MIPRCPRCFTPMLERVNQRTGLPFWGCADYPKCRGTRPNAWEPDPPDSPRSLAEFRAMLHQVTRERDTLRAGYDQLLTEVRQLRRLKAPAPAPALLVRELTRLLTVCHPDRWGGESAVATALTQELLAVRDRLREGQR